MTKYGLDANNVGPYSGAYIGHCSMSSAPTVSQGSRCSTIVLTRSAAVPTSTRPFNSGRPTCTRPASTI
jgi:hypothetical protein